MTKKSKNDNEDKEYRSKIEEILGYSEAQFDKLMVTLNSGALVLTIGFVKDIVDISEIQDTFSLKASWISFCTSLLIILVSHLSSIRAMKLELEGKQTKSDCWDKATTVLNIISLSLLTLGIVLFIYFVSKSI